MPKRTLIPFLGSLPLFRTLDPALVERVADASRTRTWRAGQPVFLQGRKCHAFYAVKSGGVKLHRLSPEGREHVVQRVRPGGTFAEAAVLNLGFYPVNATATQDGTELVEIDGRRFLELFRQDGRLAGAMVASLAAWLHQLVERIEELQVVSAGARLAGYLLKLPTRREDGALVVKLPIPKKDLAQQLCITPETLSRQLRRWADRGLVESRRREVVLKDTRVLLAIADGEEQGGS